MININMNDNSFTYVIGDRIPAHVRLNAHNTQSVVVTDRELSEIDHQFPDLPRIKNDKNTRAYYGESAAMIVGNITL